MPFHSLLLLPMYRLKQKLLPVKTRGEPQKTALICMALLCAGRPSGPVRHRTIGSLTSTPSVRKFSAIYIQLRNKLGTSFFWTEGVAAKSTSLISAQASKTRVSFFLTRSSCCRSTACSRPSALQHRGAALRCQCPGQRLHPRCLCGPPYAANRVAGPRKPALRSRHYPSFAAPADGAIAGSIIQITRVQLQSRRCFTLSPVVASPPRPSRHPHCSFQHQRPWSHDKTILVVASAPTGSSVCTHRLQQPTWPAAASACCRSQQPSWKWPIILGVPPTPSHLTTSSQHPQCRVAAPPTFRCGRLQRRRLPVAACNAEVLRV
jgi:hypothetical protein